MCGFLFYLNNKGINPRNFLAATDLISHRGPDDEGYAIAESINEAPRFADRNSFLNLNTRPILAMGHKRLSIVDLSGQSRQPCISANSRSSMLFNGEIYNFKDLSASNETKNSDTLTLFEYLNKGGITGLHKLNGMWAFCYYDESKKKLYLSRDRYGKKPAYYYIDKNRLVIASEMKCIFSLIVEENLPRKITEEGLAYYLLGKQTPFLNSGNTFYRDIKMVKPAQTLIFDLENLSVEHFAQNHFDYFGTPDFKSMSEKTFYDALHEDITASIHTRLKTEVPVTILASGGVDSSWIAGVAAMNLKEYGNLSLYTCHIMDGSDQPNEDLAYAKILSNELGLKLREIKVDPFKSSEFFDLCKMLTKQVELPLNVFLSAIPTFQMTKDMREHGIKVVLDGVGGDEIMGGYPSFDSLFLAAMHNKDLLRAINYFLIWQKFEPRSLNQITQILKSGAKSIFTDSGIRSTADHMEKVFSKLVANDGFISSFKSFSSSFVREKMSTLTERQLFEINFYQLPYYLGIADQMSMINSVENRSPYLDARLHKYIFAPDRFKFKGGYNKYALRKTMPDNITNLIRWRKGKIGIGNSYSQKLMDAPYIRECIMDSAFIRSVFDINLLPDAIVGPQSRNTVRPLFSLALLDDVYKIAI